MPMAKLLASQEKQLATSLFLTSICGRMHNWIIIVSNRSSLCLKQPKSQSVACIAKHGFLRPFGLVIENHLTTYNHSYLVK
jgi:hypothetical protein